MRNKPNAKEIADIMERVLEAMEPWLMQIAKFHGSDEGNAEARRESAEKLAKISVELSDL